VSLCVCVYVCVLCVTHTDRSSSTRPGWSKDSRIPGVTVVLQWCQWCHKSAAVVLQWCYSGVTVMLEWCYNGVTVVLQRCYSGITVVMQ
jgi:hypothetical protein